MLNSLLLAACICIVIASFLYIFYWNRFLAWVLGLIVRLLYWGDSGSSIYLEIGSIQFSIISGRILLKDIHYHSSNQTVKIVKAQVAWRYWVRRPTTEEEIGLSLGEDEKRTSFTSSCRIHLSLHGFEWFLYNRTAAYDNIMSQILSKANSDSSVPKSTNSNGRTAQSIVTSSLLHTPGFLRNTVSWLKRQLPNLDPKDLLPLGIEIVKGAIVCGNPSTPNLMVAEFQRSDGTFGVIRSRSKYDLYKQMLTLHFKHATVQFIHNDDYCEPMTATGQKLESRNTEPEITSPYSYSAFSKLWTQLRLKKLMNAHFSALRKSHNPTLNRRRTKKGPEEATPVGADFSTLEYAIERKILETPLLQLCYYVDVVGVVPQPPHVKDRGLGFDIGNGDVGPEWGIDLVISGGTLKYGPWADRQRAELQRAFFPPTYQDAEGTPHLQPGDKRVWTALRVFVELREDTTLVVPFREPSKDWQWDGLTPSFPRPRKREHASLHLTAGDKSSISYLMPMVAGSNGYEPVLEVHLDTVILTSSLNDIKLIKAESCRIHCELPSPLSWDAEREWGISVALRHPTLFLLRDHINLFTDLGKDWSSGPPSDYYRFVPMVYRFEMDIHHYQLHLYANDHNIIDKPRVNEENAIFTLHGTRLQTKVKIPSNVYRPDFTTISFFVDVPNVFMNLSLPRWNTNALHSPKEGNALANLGSFHIDGSYLYYSRVHKDNVEQLRLDFTARDVAFKALGWSIRYFMILKDNYFGSFTHFSTLYEYLDKSRKGEPPGDPIDLKYRDGKSNMMQVAMSVIVKNGLIVLPVGLPGYEVGPRSSSQGNVGVGRCILLSLPELQLHFRMHDFYMEMSLNIDSISGSVEPDYPEAVVYSRRDNRSCLVIEGLDITANRLFGPPPRTLTYVCIWEIRLGSVKASCSATEGTILSAGLKAFMFNFDDYLNAPAKDHSPPTLPDLTFLKLSLDTVDVTWNAGKATVVASIPLGLRLESNDLGGLFHKKLLSVILPYLNIKFLLEYPGMDHLIETAEFSTDVLLDIFSCPAGWQEKSEEQAEFVLSQDLSTGRVKQMLEKRRGNIAANMSSVYVPPITLPGTSGYPRQPIHTRNRSNESLDSIASQSSKSDDESFAVRDARLATGRAFATKPYMQVEDADENLSTGDESDNEDLTERSESDWPDYDDTGSDDPHSILRFYRNFTKHYISRHLNDPSEWEGSPIEMIRGSKLPDFMPSFEHDHAEPTLSNPPLSFTCPGKKSDATLYRVSQRRGTSVFATPKIIQVLSLLEMDIEKAVPSPEIFVDSSLLSYLNTVLSDLKSSETTSHLTFDVRLETVSFRLLQHIEISSEISESLLHVESQIGATTNKLSLLSGTLQGLHLSGQLFGESVSTSVQLAMAQLDLATVDNERHAGHLPSSCFTMSLHNLSATHNKPVTEISCSHFETDASHSLPEVLVLTVSAVADSVKELSKIAKRLTKFQSQSNLSLFHSILQSSNDTTIVDHLSTIQPSFLVQTGIPQRLRSDPIFRVLFHLRHSLREKEVDSSRVNLDVTLDELKSALLSRLAVLDPDTDPKLRLDSLGCLLPGLRSTSHSNADNSDRPQSPSYVSVEMRKIHFIISDSRRRLASEVSVANLVTTFCSKNMDFLELPTASRSKATSQVSLRKKPLYPVQKISFSLLLGELNVDVHPHLISISQQVARVRRLYAHTIRSLLSPKSQRSSMEVEPGNESNRNIDIVASVGSICLQAVTDNLTFEFGVAGLQIVSKLLDHHQQPVIHRPMNHSVVFRNVSLQARSPSARTRANNQLAIVVLSNSGINVNMREDTNGPTVHVICRFAAVRIKVPRSAIRTYRFFEDWKADFLPGIEATMQAFLSELEKTPNKSTTAPPKMKNRQVNLQIHGVISVIGVYLRVMHHTWVAWEVQNTVAHFTRSQNTIQSIRQSFGLQLSSQSFHITSDSPSVDSDNRVKLELPAIFVSGHLDGSSVQALVLMHFLELKAKLSHWDTLLVVQQKFGQDFNDLVTLIEETRLKRSTPKESLKAQDVSSHYSIYLKMDGFRIGFEGPNSNLYLECPGISGQLNSVPEHAWSITATDLSLSLIPGQQPVLLNRHYRSVFVDIDFTVASRKHGSDEKSADILDISVLKIHAVMQPSSIGDIGDFVDHLQMEILVRREQRATELAAFKEKTQQILKSFEVGIQQPKPKETNWLNKYSIQFTIQNVGVAFPLDNFIDFGTQVVPLRAFLFSIKSIQFSVERGETGRARMEEFSFQFVPGFRLAVSSDFAGGNHETRNRLLYPKMQAQLRSSGTSASRQFFMEAQVSGFILDLDSEIVHYVFALADVYRSGKARVAKLSATIPRTPEEPSPKPTNLPSSSFFASLTFLSGKVRMHNPNPPSSPRPRYSGVWDRSNSLYEVFDLPIVSVWAEYRPLSGPEQATESSILMFKTTIHSSRNTLRPTLLLFLTEMVNLIEHRLKTAPVNLPSPVVEDSSNNGAEVSEPLVNSPASSLQISFSLRIDRSRLELTCQPDVNVVAALNWDSGGFVITASPGARMVTFSGSVAGLTVGLKHGFLSEDCVRLDARNLAFSVTFGRTNVSPDRAISSISFVLDTEFLGAVRFSRLQDILCFKAVWLDRIPFFNTVENRTSPTSVVPNPPDSPKQEFTTLALIRIRQIKLDVDLGQSISTVVLHLKGLTLRSKFTQSSNEVSLCVGHLSVTARGNIAGYADVSNCVFQTVRRLEDPSLENVSHIRMLELRMTSGPLVVMIESDYQKLLHYRAEPLEVEIFDEWSNTNLTHDDRPLQLSFTVTSPEVVAIATVGTIPKLLSYANKFRANLEAQREGASKESQTFRISRSPKPDNPLSAVAEAMISSARNRLEEAGYSLSYAIRQHMSLRLDLLRLVVFPRTMTDVEVAQFLGQGVRGRLDRLVGSETAAAKRDIRLSFSFMKISRYTQLGHVVMPPSFEFSDGKEWLEGLLKDANGADIVGLPSMVMHMNSEETRDGLLKMLHYDFDSKFLRHQNKQQAEDIYITLNVGLYSWLTVLRKTLTREMEQAKTTGVARPDVLALDIPKSATLPRSSLDVPPAAPAKSASVLQTSFNLSDPVDQDEPPLSAIPKESKGLIYRPGNRHIERLTMRQLGDATPDVMHPFFMKKAGFSLEDSLPQYVHEYATAPLEEIMEALLRLYSRQLQIGSTSRVE